MVMQQPFAIGGSGSTYLYGLMDTRSVPVLCQVEYQIPGLFTFRLGLFLIAHRPHPVLLFQRIIVTRNKDGSFWHRFFR
jgi:hypothetical protein